MRVPFRITGKPVEELTIGELASIGEVRDLIETLKFYAKSDQYIVVWKYRSGELVSAEPPVSEDAGARAREALAAFREVQP